jgi:hypothetical protein
MKEVKVVYNAIRGDVIRKQIATGDLRKSICLSLFDTSIPEKESKMNSVSNSTKAKVMLEITSIFEEKLVLSKPYQEISGKLISTLNLEKTNFF